ncbi:putative oxidoreductase [Halopolyspora algeriensis]|uniref:Putative oxidoreductase n=1 Tax=Halopolyspora algeriensis TaxID=1500506 RepID=A0A368VB67_9ACTN|nr:DoxX family protein [Halopolyspora algeriensis]RCW38497.1 putative oxidoreductase [Halopolyspora algeriensis]TQM42621.1 putative oxidoreductase [Halopolyspora algeriensis]
MPQAPNRVRDLILLLARIAVGVVFIAHGLQKFLQWGIGGTTSSFAGMGIPLPGLAAWVAALIETLGGLALLAGAALPLAGLLLAATMVGALLFVHVGNGLFVSGGGFEYVLVLAVAALALGFNGGSFTLDRALSRSDREPTPA